jgi:hypothetical protein
MVYARGEIVARRVLCLTGDVSHLDVRQRPWQGKAVQLLGLPCKYRWYRPCYQPQVEAGSCDAAKGSWRATVLRYKGRTRPEEGMDGAGQSYLGENAAPLRSGSSGRTCWRRDDVRVEDGWVNRSSR